MAEGAERLEDKSIPQLVSRLYDQVAEMIRGEFALARLEFGEKVGQARKGATMAGAGAVFAIAGLTIVLGAVAALLSEAMPLWLSLLVVGAVALGAAWFCVTSGSAKMRDVKPELERTKRNLSADKALIKEHTP